MAASPAKAKRTRSAVAAKCQDSRPVTRMPRLTKAQAARVRAALRRHEAAGKAVRALLGRGAA